MHEKQIFRVKVQYFVCVRGRNSISYPPLVPALQNVTSASLCVFVFCVCVWRVCMCVRVLVCSCVSVSVILYCGLDVG